MKLPSYITDILDNKTKDKVHEVASALEKVKVIDYIGKPGQYQTVITQDLHGEETKKTKNAPYLTVEVLDNLLQQGLSDLAGRITLIPNLSAPGFERKSRWV